MRILLCLLVALPSFAFAQPDRWQQRVEYQMDIDFDHTTHRFTGTQHITYFNNSPDTLTRVFYHLYFNAFQPGSMMDVRSLTIADPDKRVGDRISKLSDTEIGYHKIDSLTFNGKACAYEVVGTILEVELPEPLLPHSQGAFYMDFHSQVPVQIRRSGRNNMEGIDYTMTQWYPKLAEYDYEGWHADPYVGREFYGIWGDFDVTISIDPTFVVGGTGLHDQPKLENGKNVWHFQAENVHDFAWAADPDYRHDSVALANGTMIHFYYQTDTLAQQWLDIQPQVVRLFEIMNARFGEYPYPQFSIIQGGDGGMEYPMCTMIRGHGSERGKVGLIAHEAFHNWYYGVLGSNEYKYPWMDEGFTSYAEDIVLDSLYNEQEVNPLDRAYLNYRYYSRQDWQEPLSTPGDFHHLNAAYGINSYVKGAVFVQQLGYIIGQDALDAGMLRYFNTWKFKHPNPNDFKRVMEKTSGLELDWYLEHWLYTLNSIDYAVEEPEKMGKQTKLKLKRIGQMPMPIDVVVELKDGTQRTYSIPLEIMRGTKKPEASNWTVLPDWRWTHPTYEAVIDIPLKKIKTITIDPTGRMADVELTNNQFPEPEEEEMDKRKKGK